MDKTEHHMKKAAGILQSLFPEYGFAFVVFPFNAVGTLNFISNASREDMIKILKEAVDRLEKNQYIPPTEGNA